MRCRGDVVKVGGFVGGIRGVEERRGEWREGVLGFSFTWE